MKSTKNKWELVKLLSIVKVVNGATPKDINIIHGGGKFPFLRISDMNSMGNEIYIKNYSLMLTALEIKKLNVNLFPSGTVIIPKRGASIHTNKKRILSQVSGIDLNTMGFIPSSKIDYYFLFLWFQTINLSSISDGSYIPQINRRNIESLLIPLPSLEEQKQIATLFQSIETAIEQVEEQEKRLRELRKTFCNGLLLKDPIFGNLLNEDNCTFINFAGFTECIDQHDKEKKDVLHFVGLENIEPEDFTIKTWGNIENGTTFTKRFKKGDVLFGKRRAYLKKVAVASFNGICSSDILVLRAKPNKIIPELLPFYVSAEPFIQHAISTSAGSLSPRTKWKDLGELEVALPELETQEKILTVLQSLEATRQQLELQKNNLKNLKQKLLNEILG